MSKIIIFSLNFLLCLGLIRCQTNCDWPKAISLFFDTPRQYVAQKLLDNYFNELADEYSDDFTESFTTNPQLVNEIKADSADATRFEDFRKFIDTKEMVKYSLDLCNFNDDINKRVIEFTPVNQPKMRTIVDKMIKLIDQNKANFVISFYNKHKPTIDFYLKNDQYATINLFTLLLKYEV
jgi:hypothetical protein